jgi:predicted methyltransferase
MRKALLAPAFVLLSLTSLIAQQTAAPPQALQGQQGLTDAMTRSAAIEVPRLVELLALKPGMTIADVGAGFGAWTTAFSRWTGPSGRVYATDIGQKQLAFLRETIGTEGLANVTVLEGAERSTNLPVSCCDAILIRDAFHHFTRSADVLRSVAASLKPGGRLAVIDFPPRPNSEIPTGVPANRRGHGVPPDVVIEEVQEAGLMLVSQNPKWSAESQPNDLFIVIFHKPS